MSERRDTMGRNFVNLNVNPCKMCMPLGAVTAFKGIEEGMFILHGSQGCSTYIRRHMAGHYNEPIDVASSSLSEEGTVYGGEKNLKKGLENIIKLYNPKIIGVSTTCLAETIGEDIKRIVNEFVEEKGIYSTKIVTVSTPGYGGSQFEGYYAALYSLVESLAKDKTKNGSINIIAGNLNPGEIREIKRILECFKVEYILLPDISETLDAPYKDKYQRIPDGGTKLADINKMAGAIATIEMGRLIPKKMSPGEYLKKEFGIPLFNIPYPIGLEYTDVFIKTLATICEKEIPEELLLERGRFLDGMIDSHKHNAEGRAIAYGDPELVLALGGLCLENGITPVLLATGSDSAGLKTELSKRIDLLHKETKTIKQPKITDDIDFETIRSIAVSEKANILIGNSDGKFITEKEGIPLVRIGFPIHDRVGGQRQAFVGYRGSMELLDQITNTLLENKYENYRMNSYINFYRRESTNMPLLSDIKQTKTNEISIEEKTKNHPCYSGACNNARMHIPIAPACNISCNYCNRKFDCVNESRPGVTSEVLSPEKALEKFLLVKEKVSNLKVVGIAGPGDALANFDNTKKSLELIREADPDITFCLSTNGLMLPYYAEEIVRLGVTHVTITINSVDPEIGAQIYKEVNFLGDKITGIQAAKILMVNQFKGLRTLTDLGVVCKVNIVMIKGINEKHIKKVVEKVKEYGAFMTNIMPLIPAPGSAFEDMPLTNNKELNDLRKLCEVDLKQMYHCKQCRADAIGTLGNDVSQEFSSKACGGCKTTSTSKKSFVFAVASKSGMLVDSHFGQVDDFLIYRHDGQKSEFIEKKKFLNIVMVLRNVEKRIQRWIEL